MATTTLMGAKPVSMTDNGRQQSAPLASKTNAKGSSGGGGKAMKANAVAAKGTKSINSFFGGAKPAK